MEINDFSSLTITDVRPLHDMLIFPWLALAPEICFPNPLIFLAT